MIKIILILYGHSLIWYKLVDFSKAQEMQLTTTGWIYTHASMVNNNEQA